MNRQIYVTQPSLAPLEEFGEYLKQIWATGIMTHNGPLLHRLEEELSAYEQVADTICVANGTCAMQLAIRALDLRGEIITTPFSFIATSNIIAWEQCVPVFVDIDPYTWNLDPERIESAITKDTVAILPVHVFSAPCDVLRIQRIAMEHGLKVIYDAAHAMCVKVKGRSIMSYGDVACTSFHATKLFNTCEGGACFTEREELAARIRRMRFFGFDEAKHIADEGMNGKMTEIAAGLGLANLKHLDEVRKTRREKYAMYQRLLGDCDSISFQQFNPDEYNYSYMPVLFDTEERLLKVVGRLNAEHVFPRRYFHPSLNTLHRFADASRHRGSSASSNLPVAERVASRVLCLPLYGGLSASDVSRICDMIEVVVSEG